MKKKCEKCKKSIDILKEKHVLLGTYTGTITNKESYFHWQCFRDHWEERIRVQAENMVKKMAKGVVPMAKQVVANLTGVDIDKEVKIDF